MLFGGIGAAVGALLSWSAKWPLPVALSIGAALGILLATRALKPRADVLSLAGAEVDLSRWKTDTIVLRHMTQADVTAQFVAHSIDDEVARAMGWSEQDVQGICAMAEDPKLMANQGFIMLAEPGREEQCIGVLSLTRVPGQSDEASIGLWLAPGARGQGHGSNAVRLASELCWQNGIRLITLGTTSNNAAMQRCYLAAGADLFDTGENELPDGRVVEACWYRIQNPRESAQNEAT
jgi:RimJ/RimL family protein N-acetyltransferase